MPDLNTTKNLINFIHTRRPTWNFIQEDHILRVATQQFVIDWSIINQLQSTFKVEIRDVISHAQLGQVITIILPDNVDLSKMGT